MEANLKKPVVIIGAGGHAAVVADILLARGEYKVAALVDFLANENSSKFDLPVWSKAHWLASDIREGVVGIGTNSTREFATQELRECAPDFNYCTAIHPNAVVSTSATIGVGSVVMAGAVVNPFAQVGMHCIINSAATLDHECKLANFSSVAPRSVFGGNVSLGERSFVGIGACVKHGITIGKDSVIGAGSVVIEDIPDEVVAFGSPCKIQRSRRLDERYL